MEKQETNQNEIFYIKNDTRQYIYAKVYKYERLFLQEFIPKYESCHYTIYSYLLENINLKIFKKSRSTVSAETKIKLWKVKKVLKDFRDLGILKVLDAPKGMPIIYQFNRIIEKDLVFNKNLNEPGRISTDPGRISTANINKRYINSYIRENVNKEEKKELMKHKELMKQIKEL